MQSASDAFEDFNASDRLLQQVAELEELKLKELLIQTCNVLAKVLVNPCQTISQGTLARTRDLLQSDPASETGLFISVSFLFVIKRVVDSFRSVTSCQAVSDPSLCLCGKCDRLRRNETSNPAVEVQKNEKEKTGFGIRSHTQIRRRTEVSEQKNTKMVSHNTTLRLKNIS